LAFGVGSLAVAGRAKLAVGITLPLTVLALISQPDNGAFLGGVLACVALSSAWLIERYRPTLPHATRVRMRLEPRQHPATPATAR